MTVPSIPLSENVSIPQVGFGVFQVPDDQTQAAVEAALEAGYRHIDTAAIYGNERGVGAAIASSGLARDEVFVTSKLWPADYAAGDTRPALEHSLELLGLDHLDLYLLHWPSAEHRDYVGAWQRVLEAQDEGLVRQGGVSNFRPELLDELTSTSGVTPPINQVKLDPTLQQRGLTGYHEAHGIVTEAYSPLAQAEVLDEPAIVRVAERLGVTAAQVVLRWHVQAGRVVIPKSVHPERIATNLDLFSFELSAQDVAAIDALDAGDDVWDGPLSFNP